MIKGTGNEHIQKQQSAINKHKMGEGEKNGFFGVFFLKRKSCLEIPLHKKDKIKNYAQNYLKEKLIDK